jgi:putative endonuclease
MKKGYTYIITNFGRTVLYTGVTSDVAARMTQYKNGTGSVFATRYRLKYLMYYEEHPSIYLAIKMEKQIKNWHRDWKINLIKSVNPEMKDLSDELF